MKLFRLNLLNSAIKQRDNNNQTDNSKIHDNF